MPIDKAEGPAVSYKQGKKHPKKEEFKLSPPLQTEKKSQRFWFGNEFSNYHRYIG